VCVPDSRRKRREHSDAALYPRRQIPTALDNYVILTQLVPVYLCAGLAVKTHAAQCKADMQRRLVVTDGSEQHRSHFQASRSPVRLFDR
jgi:hypothetical protein